MADENQNKSHEYGTTTTPEVEIKDRGVFDFLGKKKEEDHKPQAQAQAQEEGIVTEFDKFKVSDEAETKPAEEKDGEKKHSLADMLHRSNSNSSSSSDEEEEEGEGGEKKKKEKEKKGPKEKIKEKIGGRDADHNKEEKKVDTAVPVEKVEVDPVHRPDHDEEGDQEKKGFLDKIKGKLPAGQHKKTEEEVPPAEHDAAPHATTAEGEAKEEKKGLLEKIKEKIPGYHPKPNEEKEKESGAAH